MDLVEDSESDSRKRMVLSFWVTALNISVRHYLGKAEIVEATAKKSSPIGFRPITTTLMKSVEVPKVQKSQAARPSKSANLSTENKVDTICLRMMANLVLFSIYDCLNHNGTNLLTFGV
jgi:hypothetical protein